MSEPNDFAIEGIDDCDEEEEIAPNRPIHARYACGVMHWLRIVEDTWVFCPAFAPEPREIYFLTDILPDNQSIDDAAFEAALIDGRFGRFIVYRIKYGKRGGYNICHLWLWPDGRGKALHEEAIYNFRWELPAGADDIRSLSAEPLDTLSKSIFDASVNPLLDNPYVYLEQDEGPRVPVEFLCGSEKELQRVAIWILHTEPELFASPSALRYGVTIYFQSYAPDGSPYVENMGNGHNPKTGPALSNNPAHTRIRRLAELAFEYNAFTGMYWEYRDMTSERRNGWDETPACIPVHTKAPTVKETMEARSHLAQWLSSKVPEAERLELIRSMSQS